MCSQRDNGVCISTGAKLPRRVIAIKHRHLHVHQYDVERLLRLPGLHGRIDTTLTIVGNFNFGASPFQQVPDQTLVVRAILDQAALATSPVWVMNSGD